MKTNYNIIITVIILSLLGFLLSGCQGQGEEPDLSKIPQETGSTFMMGTIIQMKVYGTNAGDVITQSFERIEEIEAEMSVNIRESEISRINSHPGEDIQVEEDTFRVIKKALEYAELSNGRFDPSIGPLVKLWGIGTEHQRVPSPEEIDKARSLVNYKWVEIDEAARTVRLNREGMSLDLGAIAKGYAADEVRKIVGSNGVSSAYVNLGGNVLVIGPKPDGNPWKVGIQDPREERGNVMARLKIADRTIVTSGNYERYFKKDGILYHHIIDPLSGRPARNGVISTSIITKDSFDADALSTGTFILGLDKGLKLIEELPGIEAMIITDELEVYLTSGLEDKVEILNSDFDIVEVK